MRYKEESSCRGIIRRGGFWQCLAFLTAVLFIVLSAQGVHAADLVCTDCHVGSLEPPHGASCDQTCTVCHTERVEGIKHPVGTGTPMDSNLVNAIGTIDPCSTCHVEPNVSTHPFVINIDPNLYTNTGTDLNFACGQCHGGSTGQAKPGLPYMDLQQLMVYATGMHSQTTSAPTVASTGLTVEDFTVTFVDASSAEGSPSINLVPASDLKVTVNWGDGSTDMGIAGSTFTHKYTAAATHYIQHSVAYNNKFDSESIKVVVPSATANGGTTGVTVKDYYAAGIADVSLYLKQSGITKKMGATDSTGAFTFTDVPAGNYEIVAYKYGVLLTNDCSGLVMVDATTPNPICNFTQTQTIFTLTVNAPFGHVVTVKQAGVTRGIVKVTGANVVFRNLAAGNYTVDGYAFGSTCTQAAVTLNAAVGDQAVTLVCP